MEKKDNINSGFWGTVIILVALGIPAYWFYQDGKDMNDNMLSVVPIALVYYFTIVAILGLIIRSIKTRYGKGEVISKSAKEVIYWKNFLESGFFSVGMILLSGVITTLAGDSGYRIADLFVGLVYLLCLIGGLSYPIIKLIKSGFNAAWFTLISYFLWISNLFILALLW